MFPKPRIWDDPPIGDVYMFPKPRIWETTNRIGMKPCSELGPEIWRSNPSTALQNHCPQSAALPALPSKHCPPSAPSQHCPPSTALLHTPPAHPSCTPLLHTPPARPASCTPLLFTCALPSRHYNLFCAVLYNSLSTPTVHVVYIHRGVVEFVLENSPSMRVSLRWEEGETLGEMHGRNARGVKTRRIENARKRKCKSSGWIRTSYPQGYSIAHYHLS